jgi:hypothetical protein
MLFLAVIMADVSMSTTSQPLLVPVFEHIRKNLWGKICTPESDDTINHK